MSPIELWPPVSVAAPEVTGPPAAKQRSVASEYRRGPDGSWRRPDSPLEYQQQLEAQRTLFVQAVTEFQSQLQPDALAEQVPGLSAEVLAAAKVDQLPAAVRFCALVTAVESCRRPSHTPNWEQAIAALRMILPPSPGELQRIQMAPGEGKTFTITMAALWQAKHGWPVTVHTDKPVNVEQSYRSSEPLYRLFGVSVAPLETPVTAGPAYLDYLKMELPLVRYGVWSQFMHEGLVRQLLIYQLEAIRRGELTAQRQGQAVLLPPQRQELERQLAIQQRYLRPPVVISDEGDIPVDQEATTVVLSRESEEPYTPAQLAELSLAWQLFADQQPTAIARMAAATGYHSTELTQAYQVDPVESVAGDDTVDELELVTKVGVVLAPEKFFFAKILETATTPTLLRQVLAYAELQQTAEPPLPLPWPLDTLRQLSTQLPVTDSDELDWDALGGLLPPVTHAELQAFLAPTNPLFRFSTADRQDPRLAEVTPDDQAPVTAAEWQRLASDYQDRFPRFRQRLTVYRLQQLVQSLLEPLFIHYNAEAWRAKYMLQEGNHYQLVTEQEQPQIVVLGEDRQPEYGKEFSQVTQAFIQLKHGLPVTANQVTVGQILPQTWYHLRVSQGSQVSSISGSQLEADYTVERTGRSTVTELSPRFYPDQSAKLAAIVGYVQQRADAPILLCAEDYQEWTALHQQLTAAGTEVIAIAARNADEAYTKVAELAAGKVLLIQITVRGLDFGRLEADGHTFANGVIINAAPLGNQQQDLQLRGRLGNKRPSGEFVQFMAADDRVIQQAHLRQPELFTVWQTGFTQLERAYQQLQAAHPLPAGASWPADVVAALTQLDAYREAAGRGHQPDQPLPPPPVWLSWWLQDPAAQRLADRYDQLRHRYQDQVRQQQQVNQERLAAVRRQELVVDLVVQTLWGQVMRPDDATKLAAAVRSLSYEERERLMERVFDQAAELYGVAVHAVRPDSQESTDHLVERQRAAFLKYMEERILDWLAEAQLAAAYQELRWQLTRTAALPTPLPPDVSQLPAWLAEHYPEVSGWRQRARQVVQAVMLGSLLAADPLVSPTSRRSAESPAPWELLPPPPPRPDWVAKLQPLAQKASYLQRKYAARV